MILVTGSEGFIGRRLVKKLRDEGKKVMEFDTKHFDAYQLFNDMVDFREEISTIYHLGAISSTTEQDVHKIYEHNTWFSIELLKKAIEHRIPIVYASSGSVYGNTMKDGQYIFNPLNYYAASKAMIDMWVSDHFKEFSHVVGLRFFNVYGNDELKDDLSTSPFYRFRLQAKNDGEIKIFKGSQHTYRDFVCVEDVLWSMNWAMNKANPGFYDVGTSNPISFMDVSEMVADKYGVPIRFIEMPSILKGKYQTYTKAREHVPYIFTSPQTWMRIHG